MAATDISVKHRHIEIDGLRIFYREAGSRDLPVVLLPHDAPRRDFKSSSDLRSRSRR